MLKLEQITKVYKMKGSEVEALKGISITFRDSEFVSILGPSGCGKTTLLNILGGLDKYTTGDLIIDGRTTKDYNDHDWDIYRNHRIGFVFQSYNLIPQENIQENVELSLTIAGVTKEERARRAREALDKVGLKGLYKKMPNQLSGGQCQRVAIARALVNEPEILLADEPTGALDSTTSIQIMDLIKEISKERLVIMVTHNPDLAYKYSTRIVKLLDGNLIDDSNPYGEEDQLLNGVLERVETTEQEPGKVVKAKKEKAKMSWWTAFKLSAKNLWVKAKRTVMIVIAASIGIVGVSAVLSIRSGVSNYIESIQDELLSGNPIFVSRSSFDLSNIMQSMSSSQQREIIMSAPKDGQINVDFVTERLIQSAKTMGSAMIQNDITEDYVNFINEMPKQYYSDIVMNYGIDISNNIYTSEKRDDPSIEDSSSTEFTQTYSLSAIRAIATSILNRKLSEANFSSYGSMIESYSGTFGQSLNNSDYLLSQYDIVQGKIATEEDEIMIVLDSNQALTDFMLTLLGYYSQEDFLNVVYHYNVDDNGKHDEHWTQEREKAFEEKRQFIINDLMNKKFTYYPNNSIFTAKSGDPYSPFDYAPVETDEMKTKEHLDLKITGVLKPKEGRQYSSLDSGFYYTPAFTKRFLQDNKESEITKYVRDYEDTTISKEKGTLRSGEVKMYNISLKMGVYYTFDYKLEGNIYRDNYSYLGRKDSSLTSIVSSFLGGGTSVSEITSRQVGGESLPTRINFYPNSFADKYLVTDYLTKWNSKETLTINGKEVTADDRDEIKYNDNLAIIISMINTIIDIISVALIAFTTLSLVVSTVMIAIITYVSVMERIKEIGVIRSLGGRKKDVAHLFNAETFIIGFSAGVFGIAVTYLLQTVLNVIIHFLFPAITSIAALPWFTALIVILSSVLLTIVAGFIPSRSAAKKDPVVALRTE